MERVDRRCADWVIGGGADAWIVGRVAGVSGILEAFPTWAAISFGVVFLAGLAAGAWLTAQMGWIDGQVRPGFTGPYAWVGLVVAGLAVGVGTRFGGGCTSGHGICGMSRFSVRSIVAVLVFMVVGFVTASLMGGLLSDDYSHFDSPRFSGLLFGAGLYIAQMTDPTKVLAFLDLSLMATGQWDPSLILVMGGGFAVMALAHLVRRFGMKKPCLISAFVCQTRKIFRPVCCGAVRLVWAGGLQATALDRRSPVLLFYPMQA